MAFSNNAENFYSFRINRIEPLQIPLLFRITGPFRYFMVGALRGHTYMPNPANPGGMNSNLCRLPFVRNWLTIRRCMTTCRQSMRRGAPPGGLAYIFLICLAFPSWIYAPRPSPPIHPSQPYRHPHLPCRPANRDHHYDPANLVSATESPVGILQLVRIAG